MNASAALADLCPGSRSSVNHPRWGFREALARDAVDAPFTLGDDGESGDGAGTEQADPELHGTAHHGGRTQAGTGEGWTLTEPERDRGLGCPLAAPAALDPHRARLMRRGGRGKPAWLVEMALHSGSSAQSTPAETAERAADSVRERHGHGTKG